MRGRQLIKFLRAIDLMARHTGATMEDLSGELGINRRSVYRLINVMEELGIPLYDDTAPLERKKFWKIEVEYLKKLPNMKVPDLSLTLAELIALYLLKGQKSIYSGTEVERKIESAFTKIGVFMPAGLVQNLERIKTLFIPLRKCAKDYSEKEEVIEELTGAMLETKTCLIEYNSFLQDRVTSFRVDPLYLFENRGGLYLFVRATSFGDIRILAVERLLSVKVEDSTFEFPEDFDPEKRLEAAFEIIYDDPIDVKIRFSSGQAKYIKERKWAEGQKITEEDDGSVILEMSTSGRDDIKRWVISWGADACVLEPEDMRQEIMEELRKASSNYLVD